MTECMTLEGSPSPRAAVFAAIHAAAMAHGAWSEKSFAELCGQPNVFAFLHRYDEGETDGFLLARVVADECEILTLAVLPECRRKGIATHLLDSALQEAGRRGAKSCFLEVAEDNAPAIALYTRWQFAVVGARPHYYRLADGTDKAARVMRRSLNSAIVD